MMIGRINQRTDTVNQEQLHTAFFINIITLCFLNNIPETLQIQSGAGGNEWIKIQK